MPAPFPNIPGDVAITVTPEGVFIAPNLTEATVLPDGTIVSDPAEATVTTDADGNSVLMVGDPPSPLKIEPFPNVPPGTDVVVTTGPDGSVQVTTETAIEPPDSIRPGEQPITVGQFENGTKFS